MTKKGINFSRKIFGLSAWKILVVALIVLYAISGGKPAEKFKAQLSLKPATASIGTTPTGATCQLATPYFGVLRCALTGAIVDNPVAITKFSDTESKGSYSCLSNCNLQDYTAITYSNTNNCGGPGLFTGMPMVEILINKVSRYLYDLRTPTKVAPIYAPLYIPLSFNTGDEITVTMSCDYGFLFGGKKPLDGQFIVKKAQMRIQEEQANTLPSVFTQGTDDCNWNAQLSETYKQLKQKAEAYYDVASGRTVNPSASSITDLQNAPVNWKLGDNYIYTAGYQSSNGLDFLKTDSGDLVWVGGLGGQRQLYSVKPVLSPADGQTYCIPQNVIKSVECAYPTDCNYKGVGFTCDTQTFTCQQTAPCNSDIDCNGVYGTGQCINKIYDAWKCDTTKPIAGRSGSCADVKKTVTQCPTECRGDQYYNVDKGICDSIVQLQDCPQGSCCVAGGSYKPQSCGFGLTCCGNKGSSYLGACLQSCDTRTCTADSDCNDFDPSTIDKCESRITGNICTHTPQQAPVDWLFWVIIVVIIIVIFAIVGYFVL